MNEFLFVGIPYAAVAIAVLGSIVRYRTDRFSYSTQSSQFLKNSGSSGARTPGTTGSC